MGRELYTYHSEGDDVAAFGVGILSKDDETIEVPLAQHWRVVDCKLAYVQSYRDLAKFFGFLGTTPDQTNKVPFLTNAELLRRQVY